MSDSARDPIGELMRTASLDIGPDAARMERAMRRVHGEWHASMARRRRVRYAQWAAAVAAVAVVAIFVQVLWATRAQPVATIARVVGDGDVRAERLQTGRIVMTGEEIATGKAGRMLLSLASGEQVRIDSASRIRWTSRTELQLMQGTLYVETVDNRPADPVRDVVVATAFGDIRHVGTRFEVQVTQDHARVRVREGAVTFSPEPLSSKSRAPITVAAGQQLSASQSGSAVQPGPGSADPQWAWTQDIAPEFSIEGRSLFDTLEWLSRESGLPVVYRDDGARSQARATILRGTLDGLDTQAALRAVLAGSDLGFQLRADRIDIFSGASQ